MTRSTIEAAADIMTAEQFFSLHRPLPNSLNPDAPYDGCMFETFGDELEHVRRADPRHVWTLIAGDGAEFVRRGFHTVNRLGYFLTEKAVTVFTVTFRASTRFAQIDLEAATAEEALQKAHALHEEDPFNLDWEDYDFDARQLNAIDVAAESGDSALWESDSQRLSDAAQDLLDALEDLVERERAEAADCGFTDDEMSWLEDARRAIRKAKG